MRTTTARPILAVRLAILPVAFFALLAAVLPSHAAPKHTKDPHPQEAPGAPDKPQAPEPESGEGQGKRPEEMVRIFFDIYNNRGGPASIDYIYSNNPLIFEKKDLMGNMKEKLSHLAEMVGKSHGEVLIQDRSFKKTIRVITYLVKHERQPIRFTFIFYRSSDRWITYQFGFDDALTEDVIKPIQQLRFEPVVQ